ncbi:hypothetical protein C3L33_10505, partial [Rhododendron williamsianum]
MHFLIVVLRYIRRLSDNSFAGKIPEYIGNWTKIEKLHIQGSPFEGPIPSTISALTRLSDLRISDLKGGESNFPPLPDMESMTTLREDLTQLYSDDIFYAQIQNTKEEGRLLQQFHLGKFKSIGMSSRKCVNYSLHINCGGKEVVVNDTKYEADLEPRGASMFYSGQNWAFSSTGKFMDNDIDSDVYVDTITNFSTLHNVTAADLELYTAARVSPLSLTYYGLCLMNGNYTVKLHFAEIVYAMTNHLTALEGESLMSISRGLDLQTGLFTLKEIKAATKNFDAANKIGEGGFGSVYKGVLSDGTVIAVKQLSSKSKQANREFARVLQERGSLLELVDPGLGSEYSSEEAMAMLKVALLCISASPTLRPAMSQVNSSSTMRKLYELESLAVFIKNDVENGFDTCSGSSQLGVSGPNGPPAQQARCLRRQPDRPAPTGCPLYAPPKRVVRTK